MRRLHALMLAGLVLAAAGAVELAGLEPSRRDPEPMEIRSRLAALLHRPDVAAGLEPGIRAALDADDPETAEEYREAAGLAGLPVDPDLEARYREATTPARTALRTARQATAGFVSGEAQGAAGTMGVFAADLVGIGDVRDLAGEARHLIDGAPVDRL